MTMLLKNRSLFEFCFELLMKPKRTIIFIKLVWFLQKAAWLGLFYMCIPSGVALGYVYGGYVSYI
jgi:hypothetical protein